MQQPEWNSRWSRTARALCPLLVALCLTVMIPSVSRVALDPDMIDSAAPRSSEPIASLIATYATQYALDPALLQAVIKVESNFNSDAVSSKGGDRADATHAVDRCGAPCVGPLRPEGQYSCRRGTASTASRPIRRRSLVGTGGVPCRGNAGQAGNRDAGTSRRSALCRTGARSLQPVPCRSPSSGRAFRGGFLPRP